MSAIDAWIEAVGGLGKYERCPCGCGKTMRFVEKDPVEHEERFITKWEERKSE